MLVILFNAALILIAASVVGSFSFQGSQCHSGRTQGRVMIRLFSSQSSLSERNMSVDELKSELELRGVDYDDCISKNELVDRLIRSRADGRASTDILQQFNNLEESATSSAVFDNDEIMSQVTARDGSLPGGLSAEMLKALSSDKDLMILLKDPMIQEMMAAVMEGGTERMAKYTSDPVSFAKLVELMSAIEKANLNGSI